MFLLWANGNREGNQDLLRLNNSVCGSHLRGGGYNRGGSNKVLFIQILGFIVLN